MRREICLSGEITAPQKQGLKKCAFFSLDEKGTSLCVKEGKVMSGTEGLRNEKRDLRSDSEE